MIALVRGQVAVRRPDHVVVDVNGVGYRLAVSAETLQRVPAVGKEATLHAHLIVREDALQLYGFATEEERELFLLLLGVQSVGPKMALGVLSGGPPRELTRALAAGDTARFQAVPGIGKRTAERIVVELRSKVADEPDIVITRSDDPRALARDGLVELGFALAEAERLLAEASGDSVEELIGAALRGARR
ncbi:MAG: Holliday junction branch migration protein RuvA [Actinomycetota bacterium]|nr:Holliday junction branch migration protein RuvA [Actinomycetota bacterium]